MSSRKGIDVAPKNPVGKLAETAFSTLRSPKAAAEKVVDQAKGTVALGRTVAGSMAGSVAGSVADKVGGRADRTGSAGGARTSSGDAPPDLRAVPEVDEPAHTEPAGRRSADSPKKHGDVLETPGRTSGRRDTAKKAPAKKAPAKTSTGKKTAAKKQSTRNGGAPTPTKVPTEPDVAAKKAAEEARAQKAPSRKAPAKKSSGGSAAKVTASPADVAEVVEHTVAEDPTRTGAKPAKKAPAKKAPAKRSGPGAKLPAKKAPAKKAPAKKAASSTPTEVGADEGAEVTTPAGTTAASEGTNPDTGQTDLTQPGTPPLLDPGTTHAVESEAEQLRQAAEKTPPE